VQLQELIDGRILVSSTHPRTRRDVRGSGSRLQAACTQSRNGAECVHDTTKVGYRVANVKLNDCVGKHHLTKQPIGLS
jgi:hypothetical protein